MTQPIILFGSGTVGRFISRWLTAQGTPPVYFADNDPGKWDTVIDGITVQSPDACQRYFPSATWVATVLHTPYPAEIQQQIHEMGVRSAPLTDYLSVKRKPLSAEMCEEIVDLCADLDSKQEMVDQYVFRKTGESVRGHLDVKDVYFPDFICKLDDEVFIDCGAADGDTAAEVLRRWPDGVRIVSFEPDRLNFEAFQRREFGENVTLHWSAISDVPGASRFTMTGDQTAHLGGSGETLVTVSKLDSVVTEATFIKMDIEGYELEGLWGARNLIAKHSPVLAICAYHTDDHIWQIPLLIHAINPTYKLYLRRYLEQPWEMVWYAIPPNRVNS